MKTIVTISQLVVSLAIIVLVLLQERDSGMSGFLGSGGQDAGGFYQKRRGVERIMFLSTIILTALFGALALIDLFI